MTDYQKIDDELTVENTTLLGGFIQRFCQDNLDVFTEHGYLDGGCYALALALHTVLERGELAVTVKGASPERIDHVVYCFDYHGEPLYIDGDGMADGDELCYKMAVCELVSAPKLMTLAEHTRRYGDVAQLTSYQDAGIPNEIASRLIGAGIKTIFERFIVEERQAGYNDNRPAPRSFNGI